MTDTTTANEIKEFQLFKHNHKTKKISKVHENWADMTEKEADTCLSKFSGVYSPVYSYFVAKTKLQTITKML